MTRAGVSLVVFEHLVTACPLNCVHSLRGFCLAVLEEEYTAKTRRKSKKTLRSSTYKALLNARRRAGQLPPVCWASRAGGLAEASAETSASVNEPPFRWIEMGVFLLRSRFPACLVLMAAARWLKAPVAFAEPCETRTRTPLCCDPGTGRWQDTRLSWVRVQSRPQVGCRCSGDVPALG